MLGERSQSPKSRGNRCDPRSGPLALRQVPVIMTFPDAADKRYHPQCDARTLPLMMIAPARQLGTMVVYGYTDRAFATELSIARRLGAQTLEILPEWRNYPDPRILRDLVQDADLATHSAHGCWGGQSIQADRVDLGQTDPLARRASVDDLKRCIDWLKEAGGTCLVVHPGGLSAPEDCESRRAALARSLLELVEHARGTGIILCVENMPPGVFPGSRMADLFDLVAELDQPELALVLDTGHAHITADAASETLAAGSRLRSTHVHDNNGRQDTHLPPGHGTVDWNAWRGALDRIGYEGPIMLECIRHLRKEPECMNESLLALLDLLTGVAPPG